MYRPTPLLFRLIESIYRYKARLLSVILVALLITGVLIFQRYRDYIGNALLRVPTSSQITKAITADGNGEYSAWATPAKVHSGRFTDLLGDNKKGGFLDRVVQKAGMNIDVDPANKDKRADALLAGIFVSEKSNEVFELGVKWDNKEEAQRLVENFRNEYITSSANARVRDTERALQIITENRLKEQKKYQAASSAFARFKKANAEFIPEREENVQNYLTKLKVDRDDLQIAVSSIIGQRAGLENALKKMPKYIIDSETLTGEVPSTMSGGASDSSAGTSTFARLQTLLNQRRDLLAQGYLSTGSRLQQLNNQIQSYSIALNQEKKEAKTKKGMVINTNRILNPAFTEFEQTLRTLKIDEKNSIKELAAKNALITEMEQKALRFPAVKGRYDQLLADAKNSQKQYDMLTDKQKSLQVQVNTERASALEQFDKLGVVNVQRALTKKTMIIMLVGGLILGIILGCVVVLLSEVTDPSLRYGEDIENTLQLPVFSVVPESKTFKGTDLSPEFRWFRLDELGS